MGKTAIAMNIAANMAEAEKRVYFASLEMTDEQLAARLLSSRVGVPAADIRSGRNLNVHMPALLAEKQRWTNLPLIIDASSALTVAQLMMRVRRAHRKQPLDVVFVDYMQLLRGTAYRGSNRAQEVAEISASLKAMAKELGVPIVALSQLNRATETREDKRPHLADLRDSGAIEQDADIVMFVHRHAYYPEREQPSPLDVQATHDWERRMAATKGRAEIIIAKHRNGPTGLIELGVDEETMTFKSLAGGRA
jgi:replicative DNA helicase